MSLYPLPVVITTGDTMGIIKSVYKAGKNAVKVGVAGYLVSIATQVIKPADEFVRDNVGGVAVIRDDYVDVTTLLGKGVYQKIANDNAEALENLGGKIKGIHTGNVGDQHIHSLKSALEDSLR